MRTFNEIRIIYSQIEPPRGSLWLKPSDNTMRLMWKGPSGWAALAGGTSSDEGASETDYDDIYENIKDDILDYVSDNLVLETDYDAIFEATKDQNLAYVEENLTLDYDSIFDALIDDIFAYVDANYTYEIDYDAVYDAIIDDIYDYICSYYEADYDAFVTYVMEDEGMHDWIMDLINDYVNSGQIYDINVTVSATWYDEEGNQSSGCLYDVINDWGLYVYEMWVFLNRFENYMPIDDDYTYPVSGDEIGITVDDEETSLQSWADNVVSALSNMSIDDYLPIGGDDVTVTVDDEDTVLQSWVDDIEGRVDKENAFLELFTYYTTDEDELAAVTYPVSESDVEVVYWTTLGGKVTSSLEIMLETYSWEWYATYQLLHTLTHYTEYDSDEYDYPITGDDVGVTDDDEEISLQEHIDKEEELYAAVESTLGGLVTRLAELEARVAVLETEEENSLTDDTPDGYRWLTFITTEDDEEIRITYHGEYFDDIIDAGGEDSLTLSEGAVTHTYANAGEHVVYVKFADGLETMEEVFYGCTFLTAVDDDLFSGCEAVTTFRNAFGGCSSLTALPETLFADCSSATDFYQCFYNCTSLATVPEGFFDNCPSVTTFERCFYTCVSLTSVPQRLFADCEDVTSFARCFYMCISLTPELYIYAKEVTEADYFAYMCGGTGTVYVHDGSTTQETFEGAKNANVNIEVV